MPELSPKLFGDEFVEQKLSIDTESLPPVFDFLIKAKGDSGGESSKFISCDVVVVVDDNVVKFWFCLTDVVVGGGSLGGGSFTSICDNFSFDLLLDFFEAPKRFENIFIGSFAGGFWSVTLGGGGRGGLGLLFNAELTLLFIICELGGAGAGLVTYFIFLLNYFDFFFERISKMRRKERKILISAETIINDFKSKNTFCNVKSNRQAERERERKKVQISWSSHDYELNTKSFTSQMNWSRDEINFK